MPRIVVDSTKCVNLGVCESVAPDLFEVNDDGELVLLTAGEVGPDQLEAAREAVTGCPTEALSLVEE